MVTSAQCILKYGMADVQMERRHMSVIIVPQDLRLDLPFLPNKIYCNKDLKKPLLEAFNNIVERALEGELKSWNGCFNIRKTTGGSTYSLHSWGIAVDINAATNAFGAEPQMCAAFVKCFTDAGFDWGGTWRTPDGMHFQLKII
jgi:hypothetical protein